MRASTQRAFVSVSVSASVFGAVSTFAAVVLLTSCGSRALDTGQDLLVLDNSLGHSGPLFRASDCPTTDSTVLSRACMIDSHGRIYPEDGTMFVFPAAAPYGAFFEFKPGFEPRPADVSATGASASVGVFAAPYAVTGSPCCPEFIPGNQIAATTALVTANALLVIVDKALPTGTQVEIGLGFGELFKSQLNPCTRPDHQFCNFADSSGFVERFYVGSVPSGGSTTPRPPAPAPDAGSSPQGVCLLSYNTALVEGDPCCYRQGGKNTCDQAIACNAASGSGCCRIYASENTSYGGRCCLYESGGPVDGAQECQQLLSASR